MIFFETFMDMKSACVALYALPHVVDVYVLFSNESCLGEITDAFAARVKGVGVNCGCPIIKCRCANRSTHFPPRAISSSLVFLQTEPRPASDDTFALTKDCEGVAAGGRQVLLRLDA